MGLEAQFDPPTIEETWQALQFIPAHDREKIWIPVLMGLKSEFGDDAYSIADTWSQSADNYKAKDFQSVWRSIKGSGYTINTVFYLARQNGYKQSENAVKTKALPVTKKRPPKPAKSTASYALRLWLSANKWMESENWLSLDSPDVSVMAHPYAIKKGIQSAGGVGRSKASGSIIGQNSDCIIVPIRNIQTDKVQGVQCINSAGRKQTFGSISGGALLLGNTLDKSLIWYVCEGWASAYSMVFHLQHGNGVCACSFGKGNQQKVAELIAEVYQPDKVRIAQERDS